MFKLCAGWNLTNPGDPGKTKEVLLPSGGGRKRGVRVRGGQVERGGEGVWGGRRSGAIPSRSKRGAEDDGHDRKRGRRETDDGPVTPHNVLGDCGIDVRGWFCNVNRTSCSSSLLLLLALVLLLGATRHRADC